MQICKQAIGCLEGTAVPSSQMKSTWANRHVFSVWLIENDISGEGEPLRHLKRSMHTSSDTREAGDRTCLTKTMAPAGVLLALTNQGLQK